MHPLSNELWVAEVRKLLNMADQRRICLAPYYGKVLNFNGEVVGITEQFNNSGGRTYRITITEVTSTLYEDIRLGHINLFVKASVYYKKYKGRIVLGDNINFRAKVERYGTSNDRYGLREPEFVV